VLRWQREKRREGVVWRRGKSRVACGGGHPIAIAIAIVGQRTVAFGLTDQGSLSLLPMEMEWNQGCFCSSDKSHTHRHDTHGPWDFNVFSFPIQTFTLACRRSTAQLFLSSRETRGKNRGTYGLSCQLYVTSFDTTP
jgi:hypothetical protein